MEYVSIIFTVALVHLLAVISPGPDFVMIVRNSIIYSRKTAVYSAIGLGLGILVHVMYSLVGIGFIISQSIILFTVIKFFGAAYLIYLGYKSLSSKPSNLDIKAIHVKSDLSRWQAVRIGFLTNILNPKVTLFFFSLFTLVINPETPLGIKIFMGLEMAFVTFLWFAVVAYLMSHQLVKSRVHKIQHIAEKFIGIVLIDLGVKVALSTAK
jgi:RhtB (resistance to homoserine/threonine) family protein